MTSADWNNVKNILAIRLDNLGDLFMCEPALRALREGIPAARLTLLASPNGSRAAPLLPSVDEVITLSAVWQDAQGKMPLDPAREQRLVESIRAKGFDLAMIFTSFSQSPHPPAYVCYLAGIPYRVGQSKEFGGSLLTTWVKPDPDSAHQVDRNLRLVEAIGLPVTDRTMRLAIPDEARASVEEMLAAAGIARGQDIVVMNTTATCSARTYSWQRFARVAAMLSRRWPVVLTGEAKEAGTVEQIARAAGTERVLSFCGQTGVPELAALISRAVLLVTNLTGTAHIASATGTPSVVLFAGTELESQWEPRDCPAVMLRRPTACSPCYRFDCPTAHECLDITPEEVVAAAYRLLRVSAPAVNDATPSSVSVGDDASRNAPGEPSSQLSPSGEKEQRSRATIHSLRWEERGAKPSLSSPSRGGEVGTSPAKRERTGERSPRRGGRNHD